MPAFKVRSVITFIFVLSSSFLLLFMNCSLDDGSITGKSEIPSPDYTENPRKFPDPDDPNNDIIWPDNAGDVGEWKRTSRISNIDIKTDNGQICITHTKAGQWNPTYNANSKSVEDPVEGNPWIIVPLKGKAYAATYDWLGKAEPCHMLDVENLKNLYKQLPQRTKVSALNNWVPEPGDRIGFMVSGLARDDRENVKERSNMLVVTLPDADGKVPQDTCSQNAEETQNQSTTTSITTSTSADTNADTDIPACSEDCNVPNKRPTVDGIASQYQNALNKADELSTERVSSGSVESDDERWEFMDRVVQALHAKDDRFGYTCVNKDCNDISTDKIAYKCEEDSETNDNIAAVGILKDGTTQWPDPEADQEDGWKYPRAENVIDYSQPPEDASQCANDSNAPESQLDIVRQVAAATDDLYKTNPTGFTQKVVECLKDIDENWGRRLNDSGIIGKDTVAYRMEESTVPYSIDIIVSAGGSNPSLAWNIQSHNGQCGQVGGQWREIEGNCVIELEGHCTKEQIDSGNYGTISSQCFPKCNAFRGDSNVTGVTIGEGEECDDTANYNILEIKNTFEEKQDTPQKCCRISSKRFCLSGYGLYEGNCYPTCAQAAKLAGYTSSTSYLYDNGNTRLGDLTGTEDCEDLKHNNNVNWKDFTFYDPYRFTQSSNTGHISEVKLNSDDYGCCVTGNPTNTPVTAYDSDGWSKSDRDSLSITTSSSTTTTSSTNANECQVNSDCQGSSSSLQTCINGRCEEVGVGLN